VSAGAGRPAASRRPAEPTWLAGLALGAAAATLVGLFWPAFFGRVFLYGDLGMAHLATRLFYAEQLASGESALWLPHLFCGFHLHGDGQVGMFHPLHALLYRALPLAAAFDLECALGYPFALAGSALWLRRLELPRAAALFGGIVFALSPFLLVRMTHLNAVAVLAHVPWLLWTTDIALRDPGLAGAQLLGVGLGAVQLLPTLEQLARSPRAAATFGFLTEQSLHPLSLLQPWAPYLFRDGGYQPGLPNPIEQVFYLGAVVPVALCWVAARWRELGPARPLLRGAALVSGGALLLALGRYNPLYPLVTELPLVGLLRVPARYALLVFGAAAVVAAVAYLDLLRVAAGRDTSAARRARWVGASPLLSAGIALGALGLRSGASPELLEQLGSTRDLLLGVALSATAAALWWAAAHGRRVALVGLLLFAAADPAVHAARLWWSVPPLSVGEYVAKVQRLPIEPPRRLLDLDDRRVLLARNERGQLLFASTTPYLVNDARLVHGYAGLMPKRRLDYEVPAAMRVAGVAAKLDEDRILPVPGALPRFRLVDRAVVSDAPAAAIADIDVATTALVEAPVDLAAGPPGRIRVRVDRPGRIELTAEAATRRLLVISESHHPGWRVRVDGVEGRLLRAYGDFMALVLEPGTHEVALRFDPRSLRLGKALSAGSALLLVGLAAWRAIARRRA
jgi:hypothetical protein